MFKKGLIQQQKRAQSAAFDKKKHEWATAREFGASDPPATFSYPELLKLVAKIDKNSPTSVETMVALTNIDVQE